MSQKSSHILIALQGSQSFRQPLLEPAPGSKLLSLIRKSRAMIRDKGRNPVLMLLAFALVLASMAMPLKAEAAGRPRGSGVTKLGGGAYFSAIIRSDGTLWAWGENDGYELGDGTDLTRGTPGRIGNDNTWVSIGVGQYHTLAVKSDGTLWAWGSNSYYVTGPSSTTVPIQIGQDTDWVSVAAGRYHSLALKSDGTLWAWGSNSDGQLGIGSSDNNVHSAPIQVTGDGWASVAAGAYHTVAVKTDGTLYTWGRNAYGQLGNGSSTGPLTCVSGNACANTPQAITGAGSGWASVAAGFYHTVGVKTDGSLYTWGYNGYGQLGDGSYSQKTSPTAITSAGTGWVSVSAGYYHTAGVKSDGTLWAWGYNNSGQLGDGTATTYRNAPYQINSDGKWVAVAAGHYHTLGLKADGMLWTWGQNDWGQLGDGTAVNRNAPQKLLWRGNKWAAVAGGVGHTAGITGDGTLWAWGRNDFGQIGDKSYVEKPLPVKIGDPRWVALEAGGLHTVGLKSDGSLWAWGYNTFGQLGNGTSGNDSNMPLSIATGTTWKSVDAGLRHTVAVKSDGSLWAWGYNLYGQLGDNSVTQRTLPVSIAAGTTWKTSSSGLYHTAAIRSDGTLWTWGWNSTGQLGDGTTTDRHVPTQVAPSGDGFESGTMTTLPWTFSSTSGTGYWSAAVTSKHTGTYAAQSSPLWSVTGCSRETTCEKVAMQVTQNCQAGDVTFWYSVGSETNYDFLRFFVDDMVTPVATWSGSVPWTSYSYTVSAGTHTFKWDYSKDSSVNTLPDAAWVDDIVIPIAAPTTWQAVAAGWKHTLAIGSDGTLWAWGDNAYGKLGDGTTTQRNNPVKIGADNTWEAVAAGYHHSVGLKSDGTLWSWGWNEKGQLGIGAGDLLNHPTPTQITGAGDGWVSIAAGDYHTTAIKADGTVWVWGYNSNGQVGNWTTTDQASPIQANPDYTWAMVGAGYTHSAAVKNDGTLWVWGRNNEGQLGDGTVVDKKAPEQVGADTAWSFAAAGYQHTLAIKNSDGSLWGWGWNDKGQLGDGTPFPQSLPEQIGTDAWTSVTAGYEHSAGIKSDGSLWTWGWNYHGQLGDTTTTQHMSPVNVLAGTTWAATAAGGNQEISALWGGFTLAIKSDGTLWGFGENNTGQIANGSSDASAHGTPAQIGVRHQLDPGESRHASRHRPHFRRQAVGVGRQ